MSLPDSLTHLLALPPPKRSALHLQTFPRAGVLVALFQGRQGDFYVLLSRRSSQLRTYKGDTALPGGRMEDADEGDIEITARREAWEEIGLPPDPEVVVHLTTLNPFLSRDNLLVTPVVVFITDNNIIPKLNTSEVTNLFSLPLTNFLRHDSPFPPPLLTSDTIAPPNASLEPYHGWSDIDWGRGKVRIHRFLTNRETTGIKPVQGLTASILIRVASLVYPSTPPAFPLRAEGEAEMDVRIKDAWETAERTGLRRGGGKYERKRDGGVGYDPKEGGVGKEEEEERRGWVFGTGEKSVVGAKL